MVLSPGGDVNQMRKDMDRTQFFLVFHVFKTCFPCLILCTLNHETAQTLTAQDKGLASSKGKCNASEGTLRQLTANAKQPG